MSITGLDPGLGFVFAHLYTRTPVNITSSPGLQASAKVFYSITHRERGIRPGASVLNNS